MKTTKIDEIEDLADGVPVLVVEGEVTYASEIKSGTTGKTDWSRQFFVLTSGTAEVGCTLWDAEGNAMKKGESVRIENTQDKKGHWTGITKGSYSKEGKLNHTLEIRAEKVKITNPNGKDARATMQQGDEQSLESQRTNPPNASQSSVHAQQGEDGVTATRKHLMQVANLYALCVRCANSHVIADEIPDAHKTNEQFQSTLASIWIEASSRRSTNGVDWWSFIDRMPETPLK